MGFFELLRLYSACVAEGHLVDTNTSFWLTHFRPSEPELMKEPYNGVRAAAAVVPPAGSSEYSACAREAFLM